MAEQEIDQPQELPGAQPKNADDALGYEHARDALLDVVRQLETGGTSLEQSLALWERGEQLAKVCQRWLDGARARLDAALAAEGTPTQE
ncbi:exodeoxyribonuclease VII small subunit [Kitasatospora sp. NPDC050543]|uniref:exodeoxyribonuclease VII small subunit n=1 Tax=Kitasatospora sp. NPDC050543 TaxID=3364054 RepID=UPI0037B98292